MISFSRWTVGENDFRISFTSGTATSVEHYYLVRDSRKSVTAALDYLGDGVYGYSVSPELKLLDSFKVFDNGNLVLSFKGEKFARDSLSGIVGYGGSRSLTSSPLENRVVEEVSYTIWKHYPWSTRDYYNRVQRADVSIQTGYPFYDGDVVEVSCLEGRAFQGVLSPLVTTREGVDSMLESAERLFDGDSGKVFVIEDENTVVIPFSDGSTTWKEEYSMEDFYGILYQSYDSYRNKTKSEGRRPLDVDESGSGDKFGWYVDGLPEWREDSYELEDAEWSNPEWTYYENFKHVYDSDRDAMMKNESISFSVDSYGATPAPMSEDMFFPVDRFIVFPSIVLGV